MASKTTADLQAATYRGVEFLAVVTSEGATHDTAEHKRDGGKGWTEDLSPGLQAWSVDAWVRGADYEERRADLIEALDTLGAGEFVHPELGAASVVVKSWREEWRRSALGAYRFEIELQEAGYPADSSPVPVDADKTADAFADAMDAAAAEFEELWEEIGAEFSAAAEQVDQVTDMVTKIQESVERYASPDAIAPLVAELDSLVAASEALVRTPSDMAAAWKNIGTVLVDAGRRGTLLAIKALPIPDSSPVGSVEINTAAMQQLVRAAVAGAAASALVNNVPSTANEALELMADTCGLLQDVAENSTDPTAFRAIMDLRARVEAAIRAAAEALPILVTWQPSRPMTAAEIALWRHGDASRTEEVIDRNGIADPLWIQDPILVATE